MASLQLMSGTSVVPGADAPRKRRRDEEYDGEVYAAAKELKLWCTDKGDAAPAPSRREAVVGDIELQLEDSPLPPEWQRCLDIKSGRIHFYNARTQKRTARDPRLTRAEPPPTNPRPVLSLDLELNLGCESGTERREEHRDEKGRQETDCPSEMMAAVCMRCHMLVMMCRSTPACPNCKFLHPPPPERLKADKPGLRQMGMLKSILVENSLSSFE